MATKVSSKGQIVIPKALREKLNIKPGTFLNIRLDKEDIVLTPMKETPLERLYGRFAGEEILGQLEKEHADEITAEDRA
jgi:AbrB family looped-hinge helix DNA binding protein